MKDKWIQAYMDTAERFSQLSTARRLKVGACVVKDHRIISIGYNGTPSGWDNNCEHRKTLPEGEVGSYLYEDGSSYNLITKDEVIHAESNAISKLAGSHETGVGSSIFCTHSPCIQCAKQIYATGISTAYYRVLYRDDIGLQFLERCGVETHQVL